MSGRHMDQVAAFDDTIELARERGMADVAAADWSLAFDHLTDMQENVRSGNLSPSKCGRWLGWAQAAVVAAGLATLQEMGEINRRHADRPDETPPIVGLEQVDACCATAIEGLVTLEDFAAELGVDLDEPKVEHDEMLALAAGYMSADIEALREIHPEVVLASLSAAMKAAGYVKAHVHFEVRGTRCFPGDGGSEPECLLRFSTAENAITHAVARHAAPEHARIAKVSGSTVDVDARDQLRLGAFARQIVGVAESVPRVFVGANALAAAVAKATRDHKFRQGDRIVGVKLRCHRETLDLLIKQGQLRGDVLDDQQMMRDFPGVPVIATAGHDLTEMHVDLVVRNFSVRLPHA